MNAMEPGAQETAESRAASAEGRHGKYTRHSSEGLWKHQGFLREASSGFSPSLSPTWLQSSFQEWQGRYAARQKKALPLKSTAEGSNWLLQNLVKETQQT